MDRGYRVVPEKIKRLRGAKGWNQKKAAKEMGLNPALLNRIEMGHVPSPQYDTLQKIATGLDVEVDDLVEPTSNPVRAAG